MKFIMAYLRNLLVMALVIGGILIFVKIFYPGVLSLIPQVGLVYSILKLWPIIILMLLVAAIPRRRRQESNR